MPTNEKTTRGGLRRAFRETRKAERKMRELDEKAIRAIKRLIRKSTKNGVYAYNKRTETAIKREVTKVYRANGATANDLRDKIDTIAAETIAAMPQVDLSTEQIRKIVKKVSVDRLSTTMRPSFSEYRTDLLFALKKSIGKGSTIEKIARELTVIDPAKVDIPKAIQEIVDAARIAVKKPEHIEVFKKALRKHQRYFDDLTRAGEEGFQHLGLRRAGKAFLRDIKKAVNDNTIDGVVDRWAKRKLHFIQQRVARTETSRVLHEDIREYAVQEEHIRGIEVKLSDSHPEYDICDELKGIYIFEEDGDDFPMPPHHPNCICYAVYLFFDELEEAA
jgi:hypothetical protein